MHRGGMCATCWVMTLQQPATGWGEWHRTKQGGKGSGRAARGRGGETASPQWCACLAAVCAAPQRRGSRARLGRKAARRERRSSGDGGAEFKGRPAGVVHGCEGKEHRGGWMMEAATSLPPSFQVNLGHGGGFGSRGSSAVDELAATVAEREGAQGGGSRLLFLFLFLVYYLSLSFE